MRATLQSCSNSSGLMLLAGATMPMVSPACTAGGLITASVPYLGIHEIRRALPSQPGKQIRRCHHTHLEARLIRAAADLLQLDALERQVPLAPLNATHVGAVDAADLGQLAPLEVCVLDPTAEPASQVYLRCQIRRGVRPGNVKPAVLDAWPGWPDEFAGVARTPRATQLTPAGNP